MADDQGKREVEEVTQKTLDSGGILANLYFDMESGKQDELQPLMVDLINNRLLKTDGVVYCFGSIEEPMKVDDKYSTSAMVTVLFKNLWSVVNVMFTFSPAGLEVLKPQKGYMLKSGDLQSLLLNVAQISMEYNRYILSRVLSPSDLEKVMEQMRNREELGRKLLEKKQDREK